MSSEEDYERERLCLEAELRSRERELELAVAELSRATSPTAALGRHPYVPILGALVIGFALGRR